MATYHVLFIDDEPNVLKSLGNVIEREGHVVYRASSGPEGIGLWERHEPDVTILDLHMPGMDGMEVLEKLRRKGAMVIMLTGYGEIETAVRAMQLGAESFLTKPIDRDHLIQAVEKAAEKQVLRKENVKLRARLTPNLKRQLIRLAMLAVLVLISLAVGTMIGGGGEEAQRQPPIPVPVDTASDTAG